MIFTKTYFLEILSNLIFLEFINIVYFLKIIFNLNKGMEYKIIDRNLSMRAKNNNLSDALYTKIKIFSKNFAFFFENDLFKFLFETVRESIFQYILYKDYFLCNLYYINMIKLDRLKNRFFVKGFAKNKFNYISFRFFNQKQLRLILSFFNKKVINITTGKILASLNILQKSKKKSTKGEKLFIEYTTNFLKKKIESEVASVRTIFKIINVNKTNFFNKKILKLLFTKFNIIATLNILKYPNKIARFKKIRSIKKRLRKIILKRENF